MVRPQLCCKRRTGCIQSLVVFSEDANIIGATSESHRIKENTVSGRQRLSAALRALTGAVVSAMTFWVVAAGDARAQKWPDKPVRIVVPFVPGAGADVTGRILGQQLSEALGQQVLVENRPGAGSTTGTEYVARAPADGYTLLVITAAFSFIPSLYPKLSYDSLRDLTAVSLVSSAPFLIVVRPALPVTNLQDLVRLARAKPGQLLYSSAGQGSAVHLATALFASVTRTELTQVPYKGGGQAVIALLGGEVAVMFATPETLLPFIRENRLRPLAVTARERAPILPQVPTVIESGFRDYEATAWFGLLAPAGTPPDIVDRLSAEIAKAMSAPDMRERFVQQGSTLIASTPAQFERFLRDEIAKWARIIREAKIKLD